MLEPNNNTGSSETADVGEPPATKPKRAPRKAAAKKVAPPVKDPAGAKAADPQAAAAAPAKRASRARKAATAAIEPGAAPDPATNESDAPKPARKRATKRAAAMAVDDAGPAANQPVHEETAATDDTAAAPASRRRTRRSAPDPAPTAEPVAEQAQAPAELGPPPVLFVAPAEAPAPARRRRSTGPAPAVAVDATAAEEVVAEIEEEPDEVREAAAEEATGARRRRRRGRRGRGGRARDGGDEATAADDADGADGSDGDDTPGEEDDDTQHAAAEPSPESGDETGGTSRRRRRRRKAGVSDADATGDDPPNTVVHVREPRDSAGADDGVRGVKGSTRLEAKRQRRRDGRETGRRRPPILSEAEFLARREAVDRVMAVRQNGDRTQIAVLEDDILVEHYVTRASATSYVGNVYLGRVQNVLPSMEAAFVDIGKGRNGVLYAGEVNWDAAGLEGKARAIEDAISSGDTVLVQVTKDPIGHKGARLTSQISLPGRFLVYVPGGGMTGISRKLPDVERHRLKAILKKIVPEDAGVIVRTAAEGASEEDLTRDVERLKAQWGKIETKAKQPKSAPMLVHGEPDLSIRVVRDVFNEDFRKLLVSGDDAWQTISSYVADVAPDLADRTSLHTGETDLFHELRVDEQITKALDRKVWLPSGGSLVIDRTEAMTVVDVNTGKYVGSGGNLEQTVTRNNLEAAEEIVRQLRLRDIGGIVVIDFIDMVLESNRELVLRRLTECLGRDRTKHQVAEVTSLGLVQMTRKRVGEGLLEAFSEVCPTCDGRGVLVHSEPVDTRRPSEGGEQQSRRQGRRGKKANEPVDAAEPALNPEQRQAAASAMAAIAGAVHQDGDESGGESGLAADVSPDLAHSAEPQAESGIPADGLRSAEPQAESGSAPDGAQSAEPAAQPAPRRRRRTASRPAGPPVAVGVD